MQKCLPISSLRFGVNMWSMNVELSHSDVVGVKDSHFQLRNGVADSPSYHVLFECLFVEGLGPFHL